MKRLSHRYLHTELEYEPEENPGVYCADFAEVKIDKYTGLVEVTESAGSS